MTSNQINYAKHLEDVRSHRANEELAARQAAASERQAYASERQAATSEYNAYTQRMNAESQRISSEAAYRSSLASAMSAQASISLANLKSLELQETTRHNQITEALTQQKTTTEKEVAYVQTGAGLLGTVSRVLGGLVGRH